MLEGYCDDFVNLAASLAQTLEQVTMRKLPFDKNRTSLERVERGMRDLADAIGALLTSAPARAAAGAPPRPATPTLPAARQQPADTAATTAPTTTKASPDVPTGKIVMQGTTDDLPIASVFQFLGQTRKTGTLRVLASGETVTFTMTAGKIEATTTDRPPTAERLGDILLEQGVLTRTQIEPLVQQNQLLGGELVRRGLLTNEQLLAALRLQMQRRYERVAAARPANYVFYDAAAVENGKVRLSAGELRTGSRPAPAGR